MCLFPASLTIGGNTAIDTPNFVTTARKDVPGAIRSAYMFHEKLAGVTRNAPVIPIRMVRAWSQENLVPLSNVSIPWQIASPAHAEHGIGAPARKCKFLDSGKTKNRQQKIEGEKSQLKSSIRTILPARDRVCCTTRWKRAGNFAIATTAVATPNSAVAYYNTVLCTTDISGDEQVRLLPPCVHAVTSADNRRCLHAYIYT